MPKKAPKVEAAVAKTCFFAAHKTTMDLKRTTSKFKFCLNTIFLIKKFLSFGIAE